jgi:hypothetical protein
MTGLGCPPVGSWEWDDTGGREISLGADLGFYIYQKSVLRLGGISLADHKEVRMISVILRKFP